MRRCSRWHKWARACLAVYDSSVAWQPSRVCLLIHMILFGIDRAVSRRLPFSSHCPPPLLLRLLSSASSQQWMACKDGVCQTLLLCLASPATCAQTSAGATCQLSPLALLFQALSFIHPSPLPFSLSSTLSVLFFSLSLSPPLPLYCSAPLSSSFSLSLPLSISIYERALMGL